MRQESRAGHPACIWNPVACKSAAWAGHQHASGTPQRAKAQQAHRGALAAQRQPPWRSPRRRLRSPSASRASCARRARSSRGSARRRPRRPPATRSPPQSLPSCTRTAARAPPNARARVGQGWPRALRGRQAPGRRGRRRGRQPWAPWGQPTARAPRRRGRRWAQARSGLRGQTGLLPGLRQSRGGVQARSARRLAAQCSPWHMSGAVLEWHSWLVVAGQEPLHSGLGIYATEPVVKRAHIVTPFARVRLTMHV